MKKYHLRELLIICEKWESKSVVSYAMHELRNTKETNTTWATKQKILQERKGKCGKWWFRPMLAAWPSLAGERVLKCKGDGCGSSDAGSGYVVGFRARVGSQGGCPGKVWGLPHHISQPFSLGWAGPQGSLPTPTCLWALEPGEKVGSRRKWRSPFQERAARSISAETELMVTKRQCAGIVTSLAGVGPV